MTAEQYERLPDLAQAIVEIDRRIAETLADGVLPIAVHITLDGHKRRRAELVAEASKRWGVRIGDGETA